MKNLPSLKSSEVISILKKAGFKRLRQKGSHLVLYNSQLKKLTVVPLHKGKEIKKSLLRKIIMEDCGLTIDEFLNMK
ncbi:MAG: type II toxin-antitoxin system HicA family toxin [Bacteroidetes bacterium]|nr:type II toxin-antitoxin system HicA family toxin [Bacteroidota bacterium]